MADAAWWPDDASFRSPLVLDERSMAGQKGRYPGMKGITRFTRDPFPWISSAAFRSRPLDLRYADDFVPWLTCRRVYRSLGCDIR